MIMEAMTVDHPTTGMECGLAVGGVGCGECVGCAGCIVISENLSSLRDTTDTDDARDDESGKNVRRDIDRGRKLSEPAREMQELEDGRQSQGKVRFTRRDKSVRDVQSEEGEYSTDSHSSFGVPTLRHAPEC
jgi:hypothetical protein